MTISKKKFIKFAKPIFTILGLSLFAFLINEIGIERITSDINLVGYKIVFLVALGLIWHFFNSLAWYLLVKESGLKTSFRKIFINKWAAESLNAALPLGNLGGEAFRVVMLSQKINKENAFSNVLQDRLLHYVGSFIFLVFGAVFGVLYLDVITIPTKAILLTIIALLILTVFGLKLALKKGLKFKIKSIQKYLDAVSHDLFNRNKKVDLWVITFNIIARCLGTVEIYLALQFLGNPLSFTTCLLYSSFLVLLNLVFFIVPGGIGVLEGGQVAFMSWMSMSPALGMSLAIIRRLRLMILVGFGLLLVPFVPELKEKISHRDPLPESLQK